MKTFEEYIVSIAESEEIEEMSNARITQAYDRAVKKYGKSAAIKFSNLTDFKASKIYSDNDLVICASPQNLNRDIASIYILKDKDWHTIRIFRKFGKRIKMKFIDGFENVDNAEFLESLPQKAQEEITNSLNRFFETDFTFEQLVAISKN